MYQRFDGVKKKDVIPPRAHLVVFEDNDAVIKIITKGRGPALRHVRRTQRVNIDWLFDAFKDKFTRLRYVPTKLQLADILTKGSFTKPQWLDLVKLVNIGSYTVQTSQTSTTTSATSVSSSSGMVSNLGQNHVKKKKTKGKNKQNPSSPSRDVVALAYSSSSTTCHAFLFKQFDEDSLCSVISPPSLVSEDNIAMSSSSLPQRYHSTSGDTRSWETTSGDTRSFETPGKTRSLAVVQAMVKWFAPMRFWLAFLYNISADYVKRARFGGAKIHTRRLQTTSAPSSPHSQAQIGDAS